MILSRLFHSFAVCLMAAMPAMADPADLYARECTAWHTPHPDLDRLTGHWHFTVAQQHQLTRLSRRWQALQPGLPLWSRELASSKSAAEVLHRLGQHLDTLAVELA